MNPSVPCQSSVPRYLHHQSLLTLQQLWRSRSSIWPRRLQAEGRRPTTGWCGALQSVCSPSISESPGSTWLWKQCSLLSAPFSSNGNLLCRLIPHPSPFSPQGDCPPRTSSWGGLERWPRLAFYHGRLAVSIIFVDYSQQLSIEVLPPPRHRSGRGLLKSITCRWSLLFLSFGWAHSKCNMELPFYETKNFVHCFSVVRPSFSSLLLLHSSISKHFLHSDPPSPQGPVPGEFSLPFSSSKNQNRELLSSAEFLLAVGAQLF